MKTKRELKKMKRVVSAMLLSVTIASSVPTNNVLAYDRTAAVDYADKWWNSRNDEYDSFSSDCTNYASQVIAAGGLSMKKIPKYRAWTKLGGVYKINVSDDSDYDYWCNTTYTYQGHTDFVTTSTWSVVDQMAGDSFSGLQDYLETIKSWNRYVWGAGKKENMDKIADKAKKGDIIQISKGQRFTHSYVVGKVKNGKVYVYSHSKNRGAGSNDEIHKMYDNDVFKDYVFICLLQK